MNHQTSEQYDKEGVRQQLIQEEVWELPLLDVACELDASMIDASGMSEDEMRDALVDIRLNEDGEE